VHQVVHLTSVHSRSDVRILAKECATLAESGFSVTLEPIRKPPRVLMIDKP